MALKRRYIWDCLIFSCCILMLTINSETVDVTFNLGEKILEGEKKYQELTKSIFTYGDCWKKSVSDLHVGCKDLTQDVQSRLALSFANCFLEHSGSDTCVCPSNTPITSCLQNTSERIFATYREFFTHTQSICYFLQHKVWQEETEKTVLKLTTNSEEVSKKLEESSKSQSKILALQNRAMQEQQKLISNGRTLNMELDRSRNHAQMVFEEFKATTTEQRMLIFEVFDRIQKLQTLVLGEFTGVYSFVYYLAASLIVYILTSTPHTAGARIWLYLLMTINVILERVISIYSLQEETEKYVPLESDGPIYYKIWLCRKISCGIGFFMLIFFSLRYKDYNVINNKLLRELQQQNFEIQCFIKNMKQENYPEAVLQTTRESRQTQNDYERKKVNEEVSKEIPSPSQEKSVIPHMLQNNISSENSPVESRKAKSKNTKSRKLPEALSHLSVQESLSSPTQRYNLRSRTNSPALINHGRMRSPETLSREILNSLEISLENKRSIKKNLKKAPV